MQPSDFRDLGARSPGPAAPGRGIRIVEQRIRSWRFAIERVPFAPAELRERYDGYAPAWPRLLDRLGYTDAYAALARILLAAHPGAASPGARVLDCGAGPAALSLALRAAGARPRAHVLLDLSPAMLAAGAARLKAAGAESIPVQGDIRALPYADGAFDLVMAAHVIEHLPDPLAGLREMCRVLAPGGTLLVLCTRRGLLGALLQLKWRIHLAQRFELRAWLRACGLARVHAIPLRRRRCAHMSIACAGRKEGDRRDPGSSGTPRTRISLQPSRFALGGPATTGDQP